MGTKWCSRCGVEKDVGSFARQGSHRDGLKSWCRECVAVYRRESRPGIREYARGWRDRNRDRVCKYAAERRGSRLGGEVVDRAAVYERDGGRCHICGERVPRAEFHLDHLVPLALGGLHVASNVAVAHGLCNQRRGVGRLPAQLLLVG